jgi:N-acetylglucosamine-6-sulfatase
LRSITFAAARLRAAGGLLRRRFAAGALSIGAAVSLASHAPAAVAAAPNIVFILADDLDKQVFRHMNRVDASIGAAGAHFENHFVSLSLCCPSRASILRGQYAHNTGVFTNVAPDGGFEKFYRDGLEGSTVATWLHNAGYRTALIGKYLNGYPTASSGPAHVPPGWTHWFSPNGGGAYAQYRYRMNRNGTTVSYGAKAADYMLDVLSNEAASFIRASSREHPGEPFFVYLAPYIPHGPATSPPRYANRLPGLQVPRPPSFNESDVSDKPPRVRDLPRLGAAQIAEMDALYRKRRQSVLALEDLVQNVVAALAQTGRLDNTYVFFTSDNGFRQGQHRLPSGKGGPYEEDIGVPLQVRGPGIEAGRVVKQLTGNVDFAPTFAQIAGIPIPESVDGRSMLPLLAGQPAIWRDAFLLEQRGTTADPGAASKISSTNGLSEPPDPADLQAEAGAPGTAHGFSGVRTASGLTFVRYSSGEGEFYDLKSDPYQLVNRYASMPADLKQSLAHQLDSLSTGTGAHLRQAEHSVP